VQAAKNVGLKAIPLIVRPLTEREMLQFMGRENLDDYNASFSVLLETWEAAEGYCVSSATDGRKVEPIEIASLLGWIELHSKSGTPQLTAVARACHAGHKLILGGHLDRESLHDLSVAGAREIVERAWARMETLDRMASKDRTPAAEVARAKRHVAKGAATTARQVAKGEVAHRDIRGRVDANTFQEFTKEKRVSPLFDQFGKILNDSISKMLNDDAAAMKLKAMVDSLGKIETDRDHRTVARSIFELEGLQERAEKWKTRLSKKPAKATVTELKLLRRG
jgi:ParB-like chromosome segregation protein Spo0J